MAGSDGSFRSRAASLLPAAQQSLRRSLHRDSIAEKPHTGPKLPHMDSPLSEKFGSSALEKTQTSSSTDRTNHTNGSNAVAFLRDAQRVVRTIPTWVHTLDEDDDDLLPPTQKPKIPNHAHIAHHPTTPVSAFWPSQPARGRLHDHERDCTTPLPRQTVMETGPRWRAFVTSSGRFPISPDLEGEIVTEEWLVHNGPDYSRPWLAGVDDGDPEKGQPSKFRFRLKRRAWHERFVRTVLRSPVVPVVIRMIVFGFSLIALGIACSIHQLSDQDSYVHQTPSTNMAIVVDAVALVYLLYITYDEYRGKPLGLRSPQAKMRIVFLDLFFIVFDSANLSLAFESLLDSSFCGAVCQKQKALASVLLIALIAWLTTFAISVMRVMERVHTR